MTIDVYEEAEQGRRHQQAWETYGKPFFERKTEELFLAFKDCPPTQSDSLLLIKLQLNCLEMIKEEFEHFILTGKLAQSQIDEFEQNQTNTKR